MLISSEKVHNIHRKFTLLLTDFSYLQKTPKPCGPGVRKTVRQKFNYFTASVRRGWLNKGKRYLV